MHQVDYTDAAYPIRGEFAASHSRYWARLAAPGSWFSSAERIDIAREVRAALNCRLCRERKAALSPASVSGTHDSVTDLPPVVIETIHRITTDAARLTRSWYEDQLAAGLSEGQYIEIVGTVVAMVSIDSFGRAIGVAERALPEATAGEPDRYVPEQIEEGEDAWVPMVPLESVSAEDADIYAGMGRAANVISAMSVVPDGVRMLRAQSAVMYLEVTDIANASRDGGRALTRPQIELTAARVSAMNDCFY